MQAFMHIFVQYLFEFAVSTSPVQMQPNACERQERPETNPEKWSQSKM